MRNVVVRMSILGIVTAFLILGEVRNGVNKTSALVFWRVDFGLFWN